MASPTQHAKLEMEDILKTFPGGVVANDHVNLSVRRGEIHGLLGENGAGKSTLMKILYGFYKPDSGQIRIDGRPVDFHSPKDAIDSGVGMVHQHFMLIPRQTVLQNIILGRREAPGSRNGGGLRRRLVELFSLDLEGPREKIRELGERYGMEIDPDAKVWELDVGEQQRVEIVKALYWDADILILDEPTAVLTPTEVTHLFETLRKLVDEGLTVVFITHKLDEVRNITDRVTVLQNGSVVDTVETASVDQGQLAEMMVGREVILQIDKTHLEPGEVTLSLSDLRARDDRGVETVRGVDLEVREHEVVGVAGVSGNGQSELAECIVGIRHPTGGTVTVDGVDLTHRPTRDYVDAGISYIPEDRLEYGCAPDLSVEANAVMKDLDDMSDGLLLDHERSREYAQRLVEEYDVRVPNVDVAAGKLSGGNLQKLIIARELSRDPRLLVANQPTRGVDVGAIEFIRERLLDQTERGTGILLISESLDEVLQLSDRVVVMYEGQIVHETDAATADRNRISQLMMSGQEAPAATVEAE